MIDTRFQDDNIHDILNRLEQKLYRTILKVLVEPYTTSKAGQLYHSYDIKDIDKDLQDSVYKKVYKI